VIEEMSGGQHRIDDVTRTELVGWTGKTTPESSRIICRRNRRDCADADVCAKKIKPELNTLDEADFVRDVLDSYPETLIFAGAVGSR
jgi:hypothetical protein